MYTKYPILKLNVCERSNTDVNTQRYNRVKLLTSLKYIMHKTKDSVRYKK